jgi:hypothetical protein
MSLEMVKTQTNHPSKSKKSPQESQSLLQISEKTQAKSSRQQHKLTPTAKLSHYWRNEREWTGNQGRGRGHQGNVHSTGIGRLQRS